MKQPTANRDILIPWIASGQVWRNSWCNAVLSNPLLLRIWEVWFNSLPGDWLTWMRVETLNTMTRQMSEQCFKNGHKHFLLHLWSWDISFHTVLDIKLVNNLIHWHTMTAMRHLPVRLDYAALKTVKCHRTKVEANFLFQDSCSSSYTPTTFL